MFFWAAASDACMAFICLVDVARRLFEVGRTPAARSRRTAAVLPLRSSRPTPSRSRQKGSAGRREVRRSGSDFVGVATPSFQPWLELKRIRYADDVLDRQYPPCTASDLIDSS